MEKLKQFLWKKLRDDVKPKAIFIKEIERR